MGDILGGSVDAHARDGEALEVADGLLHVQGGNEVHNLSKTKK